MAEYKPVTIDFKNKGVVQKVDPGQLADGQLYDINNATSIQEGSVHSRFGSTRLNANTLGSLVHTINIFKINDVDTTKQFMYIGEGTNISRLKMSTISNSPTDMSASLSSWGQRWTAQKFNAGLSAKPYFFIASSAMKKDYVINQDGSLTTALQNWGIIAPPGAASAYLDTVISKAVTFSAVTTTWTISPDQSNIYVGDTGAGSAIEITTTDYDFSTFGSVPSGVAANGFDSDDFMELIITPDDINLFDNFILQFDVSNTGGAYGDYYEKWIYSKDLVAQGFGGAGASVTIKVAKRDFIKIGGAGTTGKTWANIKDIRLWAKSATITADTKLIINSLTMVGGSGLDNSNAIDAPYEWAYTYKNDATGHESNPSPLMVLSQQLLGVQRQRVVVSSLIISADSQVSSIVLYRRGGTLGTDFRKVGTVANTGTPTFTDTLSDLDIASAQLLEFDNDPPVTSNLPVSFKAIFTGNSTAGSQIVSLTVAAPAGAADLSFLTVGTRLLVQDFDRTEYIQITAISGFSVTAVFQNTHAGTITVTTDSVIGVPCRLSAEIGGQYIVLAGDQNNPNRAYVSKSGRPESFPTIVEATGNSNTILVGDASNPIMAVTEYSGEIIFLSRYGIFTTRMYRGQIQEPSRTPAQRGLLCDGAWAKADNELFYISDDGVYSWSGGASTKKSEAIDWFFKGQTVNGRYPLDRDPSTGLPYISLVYFQNKIRFCCRDTAGYSITWVYDTLYDRWEPLQPATEPATSNVAWTTFATDGKILYSSRYLGASCYLYQEETTYLDNGTVIPFMAQTGFYTLGQPSLNKQWGDLVLETTSPSTMTVRVYYDFATAGSAISTTSLNAGGTGYAIGDTFTVNGGGTLATGRVQTLSGSAVATYIILTGGDGYGVTTGATTNATSGGGSGLKLNILTISLLTASESFTITGAAGRRRVPLPLNSGNGREAYAAMLRFESTSHATYGPVILHSVTANVMPLAEIQRGRASDWDDYGYPHDKRLDQLVIDYDTGGQAVTLNLDTVSGINGSTLTTAAAVLTLSGSGRSQATLPISDAITGGVIICKKLRLRPTTTATDFKIFNASVTYEKYPPDITLFTEPSDYGNPYDKKFQQLLLDVDTDNKPASVKVFIDNNTTASQTLSVTTTRETRQKILTLVGGLVGKKAFLKITPQASPAGKFQLFSHNFVHSPADKGPVFHDYDWDDLGSPNDKRLFSMFIEYEVSATTHMALYGVSGVGASQTSAQIMTFTLEPSIRRKQQFTVPDGTIVKMVQIIADPNYATDPATTAKIYKYEFDKVAYPPDTTLFTEWDTLGYPCQKILRTLTLDIDTGGVAATVAVEADGTSVATFSVNTTSTNRVRTVSFTSDIANTTVIGYKFRLKITPGTNGKSQLFSYNFERVLEPCPQYFFDTFEQYFGSNGYKYMKQAWIEYRGGALTLKIYRDGGTLFYTKSLPAHTARDVERFYLPAMNSNVLNKSKSYRITMESVSTSAPFYLYRDSSRVETMNLSGDSRAPYSQHYVFSQMPIDK